jgi:transcription elongation factor Elf1
MRTHQVDCPKCKAKKSITWTIKKTEYGCETFVHKCSECNEVTDVLDPKLKEQKEQQYYLD